jgi:hypothetical protein
MQVPPDWLETDRQHGISAGEADSRRKTSGYNELERLDCFGDISSMTTNSRQSIYEPIRQVPRVLPGSNPLHYGVGRTPRCWSSRLDRLWSHYWYFAHERRGWMVSGEVSSREAGGVI